MLEEFNDASDSLGLNIETIGLMDSIVRKERINDIRYLNKYFEGVNRKLKIGGIFKGHVETLSDRRMHIRSKYIIPLNKVFHLLDIIVFSVFPKIKITQKIYFKLTQGRNRALSKVETYGRLYSCGFKVIKEVHIDNRLSFTVQKVKNPIYPKNPSYGFIIGLDRVGKNGNTIRVWKLRTMYPFSEYLQEYVFSLNHLKEGGKLKSDFRITREGRFMRKYWIDELPMLFNLISGELKLVGVRPISKHYFSLYTKELQELRIKTKPGLIPPFYADMPKSLEDIMASEIKYLKAYEKRPFQTDIKYLFLILRNIFINRQRSS